MMTQKSKKTYLVEKILTPNVLQLIEGAYDNWFSNVDAGKSRVECLQKLNAKQKLTLLSFNGQRDASGKNVLHEMIELTEEELVESNLDSNKLEGIFSWLASDFMRALVSLSDDSGSTPLHLATTHGKLNMMQHLLNNKVNVNVKNTIGQTPLHIASFFENEDAVKLLLDSNADTTVCDVDGKTALSEAVFGNKYIQNLEILDLLLENTQNYLSYKSKDGFTLLHDAAYVGDQRVVKFLIEKGFDINAQSANGYTPLHVSIDNGNLDVATVFIENYADPYIEDISGKNAIALAESKGNGEFVELMEGFIKFNEMFELSAEEKEGELDTEMAFLDSFSEDNDSEAVSESDTEEFNSMSSDDEMTAEEMSVEEDKSDDSVELV